MHLIGSDIGSILGHLVNRGAANRTPTLIIVDDTLQTLLTRDISPHARHQLPPTGLLPLGWIGEGQGQAHRGTHGLDFVKADAIPVIRAQGSIWTDLVAAHHLRSIVATILVVRSFHPATRTLFPRDLTKSQSPITNAGYQQDKVRQDPLHPTTVEGGDRILRDDILLRGQRSTTTWLLIAAIGEGMLLRIPTVISTPTTLEDSRNHRNTQHLIMTPHPSLHMGEDVTDGAIAFRRNSNILQTTHLVREATVHPLAPARRTLQISNITPLTPLDLKETFAAGAVEAVIEAVVLILVAVATVVQIPRIFNEPLVTMVGKHQPTGLRLLANQATLTRKT